MAWLRLLPEVISRLEVQLKLVDIDVAVETFAASGFERRDAADAGQRQTGAANDKFYVVVDDNDDGDGGAKASVVFVQQPVLTDRLLQKDVVSVRPGFRLPDSGSLRL